MIEVNLHPNAVRPGGGGFSLDAIKATFAAMRGGGSAGDMGIDPYQAFFAIAASIAIGFMGYTFWTLRKTTEELNVQVEAAVQDSIANAAIIDQTNELAQRAVDIENRVRLIQQLDEGRYDWPHILDEIARNVPEYTWLTSVVYLSDNPLRVQVSGRSGSIYSITTFMERLEASRFLRAVELQQVQETQSEGDAADRVQEFDLQMTYTPPDLDELETVPLFNEAQAQGANPGN